MAGKRFASWAIAFCICSGALTGTALAALPQFEQPGWTALTPEQQRILAPLKQEWNEMDAFRRKKWIGIAQRYPSMSPDEQVSMQRNMREWARLAPEERKIAREKYKSLQKVPPEKRQSVRQKWEEYSTLTEEEKERYRKKAPVVPKVKTPSRPPAAVASAGRQAAKHATPPRSPLSPRKAPQSPLVPPAKQSPPSLPTQDQ